MHSHQNTTQTINKLHELCKNPTDTSLAQVKECIENGAVIDELDADGNTALFYAVRERASDLIIFLMERNANPNVANNKTIPPIVLAASNNDKVNLLNLLQYPITDVNAQTPKNATALYIAALNGHEDVTEILLANKADTSICATSSNCSPLNVAIYNNYTSIAKLIINANPAEINLEKTFMSDMSSPLYIAASKGNIEIMKLLLKFGAHINAINQNNSSAVFIAAENGHTLAIQLLIENGADHDSFGKYDSHRKMMTPLEVAAQLGHLDSVELLLQYPHKINSMSRALHYSHANYLTCQDKIKQQRLFEITEKIKTKFDETPKQRVLTLDYGKQFSWEESFKKLFSQLPTDADHHPKDKDTAIRYALVYLYKMLQDPKQCIPYVKFLSRELERQWNIEQGENPLPCFDAENVFIWSHHGMQWPIPNDHYNIVCKRHSLLGRVLLNKFLQYGMGKGQSRWTGFLPNSISEKLALANDFFTEDRRTINGLFHGNTHNIQRVILLLAMEDGKIPLSFITEYGEKIKLQPSEIISALVREDIFPGEKAQNLLWTNFFDTSTNTYATFSDPYRIHSMLLMDDDFSGFLQDYLRFSFCDHYNHMRTLHNHAYKANYNNSKMARELEKITFAYFGGVPEFAIQMNETKILQNVSTTEHLPSQLREWHLQPKSYRRLKDNINTYSEDVGRAISLPTRPTEKMTPAQIKFNNFCEYIDESKKDIARLIIGLTDLDENMLLAGMKNIIKAKGEAEILNVNIEFPKILVIATQEQIEEYEINMFTCAIALNFSNAVNLFIHCGIDVNTSNIKCTKGTLGVFSEASPLIFACNRDLILILELLLKQKPNLLHVTEQGMSALMFIRSATACRLMLQAAQAQACLHELLNIKRKDINLNVFVNACVNGRPDVLMELLTIENFQQYVDVNDLLNQARTASSVHTNLSQEFISICDRLLPLMRTRYKEFSMELTQADAFNDNRELSAIANSHSSLFGKAAADLKTPESNNEKAVQHAISQP